MGMAGALRSIIGLDGRRKPKEASPWGCFFPVLLDEIQLQAVHEQAGRVHGICNKENGAKPHRAAEKHQAPERLTLISRHRAASLPCAGHTSQDTPRASEAEGRKPQSVKRPLHAIPVEVRHSKGIHLP